MQSIVHFFSSLLLDSTGDTTIWSFFVAFLTAYVGGILSSLTPCVYPMIPITIGVVGGLNDSRSRWSRLLLRSSAYVLGMTLVYSFLGVIAGLSGRVFGSFTQTFGWYLTLGVIMKL